MRRILFEIETETFEVETETRTEKYTAPRMTMAIGTVKFFNTTRGFGFIAPDDGGKDVFVHVSALERAGIPAVTEGQKLEFEVTAGRDGRTSAENLKLVE